MKKIYVFILLLIFIPAILFVGIMGYAYFDNSILGEEHNRTWFCKEINMYITIVDKSSDKDLIILNKTDTIFTSDDLGESLYGVELHFRANNDTILLPCDYLAVSKIKSRQYTIIPIKTNKKQGCQIPIILKNNDITVCGDADSWNFYTFKNGTNAGLLKIDN